MEKKSVILLLILILLANAVIGEEKGIYGAETAEMQTTLEARLNIIPRSSSYAVDSIDATLSIFPESDYRQIVSGMKTNPSASIEGNRYIFSWQNPQETELSMSLMFNIQTENKLIEIKKKVDFPINTVPSDVERYLSRTENIDSDNQNIKELASQLTSGEDDLYVVLYKLSTWVSQNIEYDLSCGDRVEKASWVLDERRGTCDEFASLFIALCRASGIPARYISGTAYSNLESMEGFGPHGWAEAYFPEYGWIPYDPTYKEVAWIDPSHIKFREMQDPGDSSITFQWKASNADLSYNEIETKTELKESTGRFRSNIAMNVSMEKEEVGFGSDNKVIVQLENKNDHYIVTELSIGETEHISIEGKKSRFLLFKPGEKKREEWKIKTSKDLDPNKGYNFPINVYNSLYEISSTQFSAQSDIEATDSPMIDIDNVIVQPEVRFDDSFELKFFINKTSLSNPQDVVLRVERGNFWREWSMEELPASQEFVVDLEGNMLKKGTNDIEIIMTYSDKEGKKYKATAKAQTELVNASFGQRLMIFLYSVQGFLEGLVS